VLGRDFVGDFRGAIEGVDHGDRAVAIERAPGDLPPHQRGQLSLHGRGHCDGVRPRGRQADRCRFGIMLGLREHVGGDEVGTRRLVGDD
jgi:hypothetical protein